MLTNTISQIEKRTALVRLVGADVPVDILLPENPRALILFAGCIGSDECSQANRHAAETLNESGFATLLANLISRDARVLNPRTGEAVSGSDLFEQHLMAVTDWVRMQPGLAEMRIGYLGLGAGAEAAIVTASRRPEVGAVVACGTNLERILDRNKVVLENLAAPTLFITGNEDATLLNGQRSLIARLPETTESRQEIIGWSTEPLNDPHAVEHVTSLALKWFERHLAGAHEASRPRGTSAG